MIAPFTTLVEGIAGAPSLAGARCRGRHHVLTHPAPVRTRRRATPRRSDCASVARHWTAAAGGSTRFRPKNDRSASWPVC